MGDIITGAFLFFCCALAAMLFLLTTRQKKELRTSANFIRLFLAIGACQGFALALSDSTSALFYDSNTLTFALVFFIVQALAASLAIFRKRLAHLAVLLTLALQVFTFQINKTEIRNQTLCSLTVTPYHLKLIDFEPGSYISCHGKLTFSSLKDWSLGLNLIPVLAIILLLITTRREAR